MQPEPNPNLHKPLTDDLSAAELGEAVEAINFRLTYGRDLDDTKRARLARVRRSLYLRSITRLAAELSAGRAPA